VQRAELAVLAGAQHPRMSGLTVVGVGGGRWSYRAGHGVIASNPAQRFAKRRGAAQTDRHHGFFRARQQQRARPRANHGDARRSSDWQGGGWVSWAPLMPAQRLSAPRRG
jgi:hypothetical protein